MRKQCFLCFSSITVFLSLVFKNSALRKVSSLEWADMTLISKKVLSTVNPISDLLVFCPILPTYSKSLYFTRHFVFMIISYQWKFQRNLCKSNSALHYIAVIKRLFLPIISCNKWVKTFRHYSNGLLMIRLKQPYTYVRN